MKRWMILSVFALSMAGGAIARAEIVSPPSPGESVSEADQTESVPVLSSDAFWAGPMLIIVGALFVAAACIGPIAQAEVPPLQSHDEPPGTSGHHGATGRQMDNG